MIYQVLKTIVQLALSIFYRKINVQNSRNLQVKGPVIFAVNHPNTLMDPLIVASLIQQPVYFLTKSTFFKSALQRKILQRLNLVPVYRAQDVPEAQQVTANDQTFKTCYNYLQRKKALLIFPEGTSVNERRLRPIKTGAARMALGAEAQTNFELGVQIIPVGLNYSEPTQFQSDVDVIIGQPIAIKSYKNDYEHDPVLTAKALTQTLENELKKLVVITTDEAQDTLLKQLEQLYTTKLNLEFPAPPFQLTKALENSLHYFTVKDPARVVTLKEKLEHYLYYLKRLRLHDTVLGKSENTAGKYLLSDTLFYTLGLLLGFPLYLYGLLFNYLPYLLPAKIADWLVVEEEYRAPVMLVTGMFSFPLFYLLLGLGFYGLTTDGWLTTWLLLSLPVSGFFVLFYWHHLVRTRSHWTLFSLLSKRRNLMKELYMLRQQIFKELELAKEEYVSIFNKKTA